MLINHLSIQKSWTIGWSSLLFPIHVIDSTIVCYIKMCISLYWKVGPLGHIEMGHELDENLQVGCYKDKGILKVISKFLREHMGFYRGLN